MKIVAIYSRKSKQTDKGESIETQVNLCKDYIKRIFPSEEIKIVLYNEKVFQVEIPKERNLMN